MAITGSSMYASRPDGSLRHRRRGVSARSTAMIPRPEMIADFLLRIFTSLTFLAAFIRRAVTCGVRQFTRVKTAAMRTHTGRFRLARHHLASEERIAIHRAMPYLELLRRDHHQYASMA